MDKVSSKLGAHYNKTFLDHGMSSAGVDWGDDMKKLELRYIKMLSILNSSNLSKHSILDVGCGYGGLLDYAKSKSIDLDYSGVDLVANMIAKASNTHKEAKFIHGDILEMQADSSYDYVICNGILTQKLDVPVLEMDEFAARLIRKMFDLCHIGIAFNIMTTKVNFFANNLYYRNPSEMLAWCMTELSPIIKLDHSYPLYEYTIYIFKEHQCA